MKIKPEHYAALKVMIEALPRDQVQAHKANLKHDDRVKDLEKRFRWDLLHAGRYNADIKESWVSDELYPYLDDTHIDTALKAIVKELEL